MKNIGIVMVCVALAFGGLMSCSTHPYYHDSEFDLAMNLGLGKPIADIESKLTGKYAKRAVVDSRSGTETVSWKLTHYDCHTKMVHPHERYDFKKKSWKKKLPYKKRKCKTFYYDIETVYESGVLAEWSGSQNMGANSFKFTWWSKHDALIGLLDLHQQGDLAIIRKMYAAYPHLNTRKNHLLGAVIAATNDQVDLVRFYINEKHISPDEKTDAWLTIKGTLFSSNRKRRSNVSIRDAARHTNAKRVLELIGES